MEYIEINIERCATLQKCGTSDIKIYNTFGECVMTESNHPMTPSHRMNIKYLPVGIYFIKLGNYMEKSMVVR